MTLVVVQDVANSSPDGTNSGTPKYDSLSSLTGAFPKAWTDLTVPVHPRLGHGPNKHANLTGVTASRTSTRDIKPFFTMVF